NVSDFVFDKKGQYLVMIMDAAGQAGNGVQIRHLASATQTTLDSGKANYRGLTLADDGESVTVLKGVDDPAFETKRYSHVAFTNLGAKPVRKVVYDPQSDPTFPANMTISPNRVPTFTDDRDALVFGIHELKKRTASAGAPARGNRGTGALDDGSDGDPAY